MQRPFRSRRLCRAVACAPGIPAKGRRDVRGNAVSQTALHVVAAGPCPLFCPSRRCGGSLPVVLS
ncbi:hypothetical protein GNZ04_25120, partial [Escherichia coli]|nr:hypothetical protein [Escherichia coli]